MLIQHCFDWDLEAKCERHLVIPKEVLSLFVRINVASRCFKIEAFERISKAQVVEWFTPPFVFGIEDVLSKAKIALWTQGIICIVAYSVKGLL